MIEYLVYFFAAVGVFTSFSWIILWWIIRAELKSLEDVNPLNNLDDLK